MMGFVQVALMAADRQPRVLGQQVGPPVHDRGQFRDRVLQFRLGEGMGAGIAAGGTGDLGDDDTVSFCRSRPARSPWPGLMPPTVTSVTRRFLIFSQDGDRRPGRYGDCGARRQDPSFLAPARVR